MEDYSLYELEKDYFLGNFQSCVNKANSMKSTKESLFYMCLSYCQLKKFDILNLEASKSDELCIKLVQMLSEYLNDEDSKLSILQDIDSMLEDRSVDLKDEQSRLVISSIYCHARNFASALRVLHPLDSLSAMFSKIGIYIQMNRFDLAEKQLKQMQGKDDYATLTLLAAAQVKLVTNKAKEAHDIASELEDKYRATPLLKNIQTAAAISLENLDLAKEHCDCSLDMDNENSEALINMIYIISKTKSSSEIKDRHFQKFKTLYPKHDLIREIESIPVELGN